MSLADVQPRQQPRRRKPWRKLLWVRQSEYPDNWVDETFLEDLQRNVNVRAYDFWPLVADGTVITQHLSSIVIFVSAFVAIYTERIPPETVAGLSSALTASAYLFTTDRLTTTSTTTTTAKSATLIFFTLLGLSPVLKSLTRSTTSDSIWALSTWLFLANIFFHDYSSRTSSGSHDALKFPGSVATNAAVMASVVLASRLPTTTHVFSLMLFAVEWFALFPIFRRLIHDYSWRLHISLTVALLMVAFVVAALVLSLAIAWLFMASMFFIQFVCPLWLISLQKYKKYLPPFASLLHLKLIPII